MTTFENC